MEELRIEWNAEMNEISLETLPEEFLHRLKTVELRCLPSQCEFLPKLINLHIYNLILSDSSVEEISLPAVGIHEKKHLDVLPELRQLVMCKLPNLKRLMEENSQSNIVFEQMKLLKVLECGKLEVLVPASMSLRNLSSLTVSKCHALPKLLTSSTARSMVQLRWLVISECELIQEIGSCDGDGVDKIALDQLNGLLLYRLPCLASFCSSNCSFNFPALKAVLVSLCPNMRTFVQEVQSTPKLKRVYIAAEELEEEIAAEELEEEDRDDDDFNYNNDKNEWCWKGNLNSTIQHLFMEKNMQRAEQSREPLFAA